MKKLLLGGLAACALLAAPVANAQTVECQVTGVLLIVAINGPVTVCAVDVPATNTNSISIPVTANVPILPIDPHFGQ